MLPIRTKPVSVAPDNNINSSRRRGGNPPSTSTSTSIAIGMPSLNMGRRRVCYVLAAAALAALACAPSAEVAAAGPPSAAATMEALFSDLGSAHVLPAHPRDTTNATISQLDVVPRGGGGSGYIAAYPVDRGVGLALSPDFARFVRTGTFEQPGASSPVLAAVTGGNINANNANGTESEWWVLAFETTAVPAAPDSGWRAGAPLLRGAAAYTAVPAARPADPACVGYAVASAGVEAVNGCYRPDGGGRRWVKDAEHAMYPSGDGGRWHIGTEGKAVFYASLHPSSTPPESVATVCGAVWAADKNSGGAPCTWALSSALAITACSGMWCDLSVHLSIYIFICLAKSRYIKIIASCALLDAPGLNPCRVLISALCPIPRPNTVCRSRRDTQPSAGPTTSASPAAGPAADPPRHRVCPVHVGGGAAQRPGRPGRHRAEPTAAPRRPEDRGHPGPV